MGIFDFNSYHSFYIDLHELKASLHQNSGLVSHHCYGLKNQTAHKYGTIRANMSTVMNKGVKINFKAVTNQVFKLGLLVELGTYIAK